MAAHRSLYTILNVSPDAEPVVIEAAYRALMKKYHPDQGTAEGPQAAEINGAFATLRDPERRSAYDRREWQRQQEMLRGPQPPPVTIVRRGTGLFGWTGWALATVLAAVILAAAQGGGAFGLRPPQMRNVAAALPEPPLGSQPNPPKEWLLTPASIVDSVEPAVADADGAKIAPSADAPALTRSVAGRSTKPRRPQGATRRPRAAEESDFLEREGYIY